MPTKTAPQRQFDNALSVREIAKILGLSVDRARALVREGKIRAFQANRGAYRVFPADLAAFIESRIHRPKADNGQEAR